MTNSPRDQNRVTMLMGVSSVDGTATPVYVDPITHGILIDGIVDTLTPTVATKVPHDDNRVRVTAGGKSTDSTPLALHANPTNNRLLVNNS